VQQVAVDIICTRAAPHLILSESPLATTRGQNTRCASSQRESVNVSPHRAFVSSYQLRSANNRQRQASKGNKRMVKSPKVVSCGRRKTPSCTSYTTAQPAAFSPLGSQQVRPKTHICVQPLGTGVNICMKVAKMTLWSASSPSPPIRTVGALC
jgi:hypothetical protein